MFADIRVILFDMGGTLVDYPVPSWPRLAGRCIEGLYRFLVHTDREGPPPAVALSELDQAHVHRLRAGPGTALLHRAALALRRMIRSLSGYTLPRMAEMCARPLMAEGRLFDDTLPTIQALRRRGYRLGLVSNTPWGTPEYLWENQLRRFGLAPYFDVCLFSSVVGFRKPDTRILQTALARLGVEAPRALFVGDNPDADIPGARRLGMRAALVRRTAPPSATTPAPPGRSPAADVTIESLTELLALLPPRPAGPAPPGQSPASPWRRPAPTRRG